MSEKNYEEDYLEEEYSPPPLQKGDRLFVEDSIRIKLDNKENYAHQGFKRTSFFSYALGYSQAAERLVQYYQESYPANSGLVFPIVFLYRQYLELILKDLILTGNEKIGKTNFQSINKTHNLKVLWDDLKKQLLQLSLLTATNKEEIEALEDCITEFQKVDARADAFRYPTDTKNNPHFEGNQTIQQLEYINLKHLDEKMSSIFSFFSGISLQIITYKKGY